MKTASPVIDQIYIKQVVLTILANFTIGHLTEFKTQTENCVLALNIKPGDYLEKSRQRRIGKSRRPGFFHRMFFGSIFDIRHAKERLRRKNKTSFRKLKTPNF